MKIRFPLVAQMLLWGVLNLVFLGALFYGFFRTQGSGLNSFFKGRGGERVQAVGEVLLDQMLSTDPTNWTRLLAHFSSAYHLQFCLFSGQARQIAGPTVALPPKVVEGIRRLFGTWQPEYPSRPKAFVHTFHPSGALMRTFHPSRYWVLVRLPAKGFAQPPDSGLRGGLVLVATSNTISGGGLFFDFIPWIKVGFGALLGRLAGPTCRFCLSPMVTPRDYWSMRTGRLACQRAIPC